MSDYWPVYTNPESTNNLWRPQELCSSSSNNYWSFDDSKQTNSFGNQPESYSQYASFWYRGVKKRRIKKMQPVRYERPNTSAYGQPVSSLDSPSESESYLGASPSTGENTSGSPNASNDVSLVSAEDPVELPSPTCATSSSHASPPEQPSASFISHPDEESTTESVCLPTAPASPRSSSVTYNDAVSLVDMSVSQDSESAIPDSEPKQSPEVPTDHCVIDESSTRTSHLSSSSSESSSSSSEESIDDLVSQTAQLDLEQPPGNDMYDSKEDLDASIQHDTGDSIPDNECVRDDSGLAGNADASELSGATDTDPDSGPTIVADSASAVDLDTDGDVQADGDDDAHIGADASLVSFPPDPIAWPTPAHFSESLLEDSKKIESQIVDASPDINPEEDQQRSLGSGVDDEKAAQRTDHSAPLEQMPKPLPPNDNDDDHMKKKQEESSKHTVTFLESSDTIHPSVETECDISTNNSVAPANAVEPMQAKQPQTASGPVVILKRIELPNNQGSGTSINQKHTERVSKREVSPSSSQDKEKKSGEHRKKPGVPQKTSGKSKKTAHADLNQGSVASNRDYPCNRRRSQSRGILKEPVLKFLSEDAVPKRAGKASVSPSSTSTCSRSSRDDFDNTKLGSPLLILEKCVTPESNKSTRSRTKSQSPVIVEQVRRKSRQTRSFSPVAAGKGVSDTCVIISDDDQDNLMNNDHSSAKTRNRRNSQVAVTSVSKMKSHASKKGEDDRLSDSIDTDLSAKIESQNSAGDRSSRRSGGVSFLPRGQLPVTNSKERVGSNYVDDSVSSIGQSKNRKYVMTDPDPPVDMVTKRSTRRSQVEENQITSAKYCDMSPNKSTRGTQKKEISDQNSKRDSVVGTISEFLLPRQKHSKQSPPDKCISSLRSSRGAGSKKQPQTTSSASTNGDTSPTSPKLGSAILRLDKLPVGNSSDGRIDDGSEVTVVDQPPLRMTRNRRGSCQVANTASPLNSGNSKKVANAGVSVPNGTNLADKPENNRQISNRGAVKGDELEQHIATRRTRNSSQNLEVHSLCGGGEARANKPSTRRGSPKQEVRPTPASRPCSNIQTDLHPVSVPQESAVSEKLYDGGTSHGDKSSRSICAKRKSSTPDAALGHQSITSKKCKMMNESEPVISDHEKDAQTHAHVLRCLQSDRLRSTSADQQHQVLPFTRVPCSCPASFKLPSSLSISTIKFFETHHPGFIMNDCNFERFLNPQLVLEKYPTGTSTKSAKRSMSFATNSPGHYSKVMRKCNAQEISPLYVSGNPELTENVIDPNASQPLAISSPALSRRSHRNGWTLPDISPVPSKMSRRSHGAQRGGIEDTLESVDSSKNGLPDDDSSYAVARRSRSGRTSQISPKASGQSCQNDMSPPSSSKVHPVSPCRARRSSDKDIAHPVVVVERLSAGYLKNLAHDSAASGHAAVNESSDTFVVNESDDPHDSVNFSDDDEDDNLAGNTQEWLDTSTIEQILCNLGPADSSSGPVTGSSLTLLNISADPVHEHVGPESASSTSDDAGDHSHHTRVKNLLDSIVPPKPEAAAPDSGRSEQAQDNVTSKSSRLFANSQCRVLADDIGLVVSCANLINKFMASSDDMMSLPDTSPAKQKLLSMFSKRCHLQWNNKQKKLKKQKKSCVPVASDIESVMCGL